MKVGHAGSSGTGTWLSDSRATNRASGIPAARRRPSSKGTALSCLPHHISANQTAYELIGRVRCGIDQLSFRV
jgi:hypothetical protein